MVPGDANKVDAMTSPGSYEFLRIDRVRWGTSLASIVAAEVAGRDSRRVLLVASGSLLRDTTLVSDLTKVLGDSLVRTFGETVAHVPRSTVLACRDAIVESAADLVVTIGGGTPIDTVKMALLLLSSGHDRFDDLAIRTDPDGTRHAPEIGPSSVRQIVVPTTLSGAEFSDLAGCVNPLTSVKQLFTAPEIGSAAVLLAPEFTQYTPDWLWLSTGVRALDHAVESLCSTASNPFTDSAAVAAVELLNRSLQRTKADPGDLDARLESQQAVWLACAGLNRVPWGASHGIGHQLGAVAGVAHGYCSCVMLPHVLRYNASVTVGAQERISRALGVTGSAGDAVHELVSTLGLPTRLRDVGVSWDQLPTIAELSVPNMFVRQNPRPLLSPEPILQILEAAW